MAELVTDCPRCGAKKISFDVAHSHVRGMEYGWQHLLEAYAICRSCSAGSIFVLKQSDINHGELFKRNPDLAKIPNAITKFVQVLGFVSKKDFNVEPPPPHLPELVDEAFREGAACKAIGCSNAAAAMFRLAIDHATVGFLPPADQEGGPNARTRRDLGLRMGWLFDNGMLPEALRELSACIREDGNDAVHRGNLTPEDAADIADFAYVLLERLYSEPQKLRLAAERRAARRVVQ
ncbi:DUF4145 domain-containing protein [Achromobacter animicus]|uniref:DUF4145 domain-containing protein n=1 Tax=Achromobacter animicus TaxID=1389935 RepID=UPI00146741EE|nr:DUF4145 domain-containing protein [Achromobacter animicus]CAB3901295.1 hypothetical protein LMG26691_04504 [Achromobacter animicus]